MDSAFKLFKKEVALFENELSEFKYSDTVGDAPELNGVLALTDDNGHVLDVYQIRIVCSTNYPLTFPFVFETGGRIPINIDWHVYPDGHACICSVPEEIIICSKGINLKSFIEQQLKPYFFNQKYREMNGFFLKERPHGEKGNIEFFQEVFKIKDVRLIAQLLNYIKLNTEPNRVQKCFCGSGTKYRQCHREAFRMFKLLPGQTVDYFIGVLFKYANGK